MTSVAEAVLAWVGRVPAAARRATVRWGRATLQGGAAATLLAIVLCEPALAQVAGAGATSPYGDFPVVGSRVAIWVAAQVHLLFAAFVLGVPMFAVVAEAIGIFGGEKRYDKLAKEFTRLLLVAYSATAIWGAILVFGLVTLYPGVWGYLAAIFAPSMWVYVALFFFESFTLYLYYYGWDRWTEGRAKWGHWTLGILLNVWGTLVMFIANSWLTYMMSPPADVTPDTAPQMVQFWSAFANATWMPINIHRLIANVVFGGAIVGAYAAYRFLVAETDEERAHYDWMGYVGNFVAIGALIVLPFAGYWLGREIYEFNAQMGQTLMGGFMSWLWIIQAFLIGVLFLTGNYYLWVGMGRIPGAERYTKYTKWMLIVLVLGVLVWATPHTMIADRDELAAMGGSHHPFLGVLGVMSAKNTAVNLMILTTFLSFLLYRRANKEPTGPLGSHGHDDPGRNLRHRERSGRLLRYLRLLRDGDRAHRVLRVSGSRGARDDRHGNCDRYRHDARRPLPRHHPLGPDAPALAVRTLHPGGHVHLAHGADGLRTQRHPAALARLGGDA